MPRGTQEKYIVEIITVEGTRENPARDKKTGQLVQVSSKANGIMKQVTEGGFGQLKKLVGDYDPDMESAEFAASAMDPRIKGALPANCHHRVKRLGVDDSGTQKASFLSQLGFTVGVVDEIETQKIQERR